MIKSTFQLQKEVLLQIGSIKTTLDSDRAVRLTYDLGKSNKVSMVDIRKVQNYFDALTEKQITYTMPVELKREIKRMQSADGFTA